MDLGSKLKVVHRGFLFFSIFYFVAAIANIIILGFYGLGLFHVTLISVLSFVTAFGLYKSQSWVIWFVVGLFFIVTAYGATMLNVTIKKIQVGSELSWILTAMMWVLYLVLTWITTVYVAAKRKHLR